jgi:hypothetical protein
MGKIVQEKFQVNYKDVPEDNVWVSDKSARVKKGTPGREGLPGGDRDSKFVNNAVFFNGLPPGTDMEDQEMTDQRVFNMSINGNMAQGRNAGDLTNNEVTADSLRKGFSKKKLLQTDDEYTREHNDPFYDDVGGFIERNNMLDRI